MSAAPIHHKWQEIADLPADLEQFRDRELESLYQVWLDQRATLNEKVFAAELAREWSIETGIIEGVYTLDRGVTQTLIEHGIDSSYIPHDSTNRDPELVARIIRAHRDALEGLFAFVAGGRELSTGYIKELHAALLLYQETTTVFDQFGTRMEIRLEKGAYKRYNNNPTRDDGSIHEYCPWEHVASEMDRMVELHGRHAEIGVSAIVEAGWLHHTFTQIHPFQDGNGRVARALASLIQIKNGLFPLVVRRDDRAKYIAALEAADDRDLSPIVGLFARLQKRDLTRAIGKVADSKSVATVDEAVAVTRDLLVDLGRIIPPQYLEAKMNSGKLFAMARDRLGVLSSKLASDIARANSGFKFSVVMLGAPPTDALRLIAEKLQYDPNPADYFQNSVLALGTQGAEARIVACFQTVGAAFRGLVGAVVYFQVDSNLPVPLSDDIFRIHYTERIQEVQPRFEKWLDDCLIRGLAEWRKTLV